MKPSLNYIFHKVLRWTPGAYLVDEHAWKFDFEWLSMVNSNAIGRNGFLYFICADLEIHQPQTGKAAFACVLTQSRLNSFTGIPRIVVPDECDMQALFDYVVDELDRFRHWNDAVNEILLDDASLQDLLDITFALIPRAMYIADPCWRMIARVDGSMDEMSSYWLHEIRHGCLPLDVTERLNASGEHRRIIESNKAFLMHTQSFNIDYIAKAVKHRGRTVAFFFIIDTWGDLGPCEIEIADKLGSLLGPVFGLKKETVLGNDVHEQGLAMLLDSASPNKQQLASALSATTGWSVDGDFHIAAMEIVGAETNEPLARMQAESQLGSGFDSCVIPGDNMTYVAYNTLDGRQDMLVSHLRKCAKTLKRNIVLSGRFSNFSIASLYFRQFKTLRGEEGGLGRFGDARLVTYDQLLPSLLARWSKHKLPPNYVVELLETHDAEHGTDYLRTLYTYLLCERNTAATAEVLFLHRNSTRNRLEKIDELIDVDLDDASVRMGLLLALACKMQAHE